MTSYKNIFDRALRMISDPTLAQWPEEELSNELYAWLESAIAGIPKLSSQLSDRDKFDVDDIETKGFADDLSDTVKKVLALAMTREWLRPQIDSITNTLQRSSKKESYSQTDFLKGLMSRDKSIDEEIKKLLRDDTYVDNEYFN